jgi:hypothetical protein
VTKLSVYLESSQSPIEELQYTWSDPWAPHSLSLPSLVRRDGNGDGEWDVWVEPQNRRDGNAKFLVDTDLDGSPDWSFSDSWASIRASERIKEKRGF